MLRFHRIDPSLNIARFYELSVQPTLFGEHSLLRSWGRIGSRGRSLIETHTDADGAQGAFRRQTERRQRRGYLPVST